MTAIDRLTGFLSANHVDAFLVSNLHNVRYLTGFTGSNGMLLVLADEAVFLTDPRYRIQAAQQVKQKTVVAAGPLLATIASMATRKRVRRIAVEPSSMTLADAESLRGMVEIHAAPGLHDQSVGDDQQIAPSQHLIPRRERAAGSAAQLGAAARGRGVLLRIEIHFK